MKKNFEKDIIEDHLDKSELNPKENRTDRLDKPEPSLKENREAVFKSSKTGKRYDSYAAMIEDEAEFDRLERERAQAKDRARQEETAEKLVIK